jgi:hypothetical protein
MKYCPIQEMTQIIENYCTNGSLVLFLVSHKQIIDAIQQQPVFQRNEFYKTTKQVNAKDAKVNMS